MKKSIITGTVMVVIIIIATIVVTTTLIVVNKKHDFDPEKESTVYIHYKSPIKYTEKISENSMVEDSVGKYFIYRTNEDKLFVFFPKGNSLYLKFTNPPRNKNGEMKFFVWTTEKLSDLYIKNPEIRFLLDPQKPCYGIPWAGSEAIVDSKEKLPLDVVKELYETNKIFKRQVKNLGLKTCDDIEKN